MYLSLHFTTILPQNMIDVPEKYDLVFFWICNDTPLCNSTKCLITDQKVYDMVMKKP